MALKPKITMKRWKASNEREIIQYWSESETFKFIEDSKKPVYIIDTPPPYVSGRAHLGFAIHYAQIDMIARYYRMQGKNVIFPACADRNGLPVEVKVEQKLNKSMHEMDREEFLQICKRELDIAEENTIQVMKWMGLSCNSFYGSPEIYYQTDSPQYRLNTQRTFLRAWHTGLITHATRPNNWCIDCGTTIADAEIEYTENESFLHEIIFNVENSDETITISTTRPELIPTCELIIYHPTDSRYTDLEGKYALTPLFKKKIPIRKHREADPEFGTGIMMICAFGDKSDVKILREERITNPKTVIDADGRINEVGEKYSGMLVKEAQAAIIEDLKKNGSLIQSTKTLRRVPVCWRSKTPIEIIAMEEYYIKQLEVIPEIKKIVEKMDFFPKSNKIILDNWISTINTDWAISRRRFYGTSIPIWYCSKCQTPNVPKEEELDRYYDAWKEQSPMIKCIKCGKSLKDAQGEVRTFDTWFDSSISELAACNFGEIFFQDKEQQFFEKNFPCSVRPQGKEIVRTWLFYTILRSFHLFKKPPFRQVWISGLVRDPYGGKMSKSEGNSVDPLLFLQPQVIPKNTPKTLRPDKDSWKVIAKLESSPKFSGKQTPNLYYGADSVRLTSCLQGSHGSDIRFSLSKLDGNAKFITKLWNISRFISIFPNEDRPKKLEAVDQWLLASLDALTSRCLNGYAKLDFSVPAENLYNWVWNLFAAHYIELVKSRAYGEENMSKISIQSARYSLHTSLQAILKLLAPIVPFVTEKIFQSLYDPEISIHLENLPQPDNPSTEEQSITEDLLTLDSAIWKAKKDKALSLKEPVSLVFIPKSLENFTNDLKIMHNIVTIKMGEPDNSIEGLITKKNCSLKL
ncbi:valine--tRNA ligase [Candidatus Heimdallarchaeota archaeon B3_Heim]|nr:MAG: valine--tRNA ligase [Candidatus Heimdallarchaeota archaeon B3_Heim]